MGVEDGRLEAHEGIGEKGDELRGYLKNGGIVVFLRVADAEFLQARQVLSLDVARDDDDRAEEVPGPDLVGADLGIEVRGKKAVLFLGFRAPFSGFPRGRRALDDHFLRPVAVDLAVDGEDKAVSPAGSEGRPLDEALPVVGADFLFFRRAERDDEDLLLVHGLILGQRAAFRARK